MKEKRPKDIPQSSRDAVRDRSGGRCEIRRADCLGFATEQHHKKKRSHGGSHHPGNLVDACRNCHQDIENHKPGTEKWRTRSWQKEGESEADV